PIELAAYVATTMVGFPEPRPFCPKRYVGTWTQVLPVVVPAARWEFHSGGAFNTDEAFFRKFRNWKAHRSWDDPDRHEIRLGNESIGAAFKVRVFAEREMRTY